MQLTKITDLAAQLNLTSRTLRYYEQAGLIRSVRPDFEKYRFYDEENVERLKQIVVLRKMQIPIKDIFRIYESRDAGELVRAFVSRIDALDAEITALSELKRIVDEFLRQMRKRGVTKISALPLLYEELGKQLESIEEREPVTYARLAEVSDRLTKPPETRIVFLPPMRVLSSRLREGGESDTEAFRDHLELCGIAPELRGIAAGLPGSRALFEYQDSSGQSVIIRQLGADLVNDSPFVDHEFAGGLFAAAGVYADDDLPAFCRAMMREFEDNQFYAVDFRAGAPGVLIGNAISPDSRRELLEMLIPLKKRLPNAALYEPFERVENITVAELEAANLILSTVNVAMDKLIPIYSPYYNVNERGEAEYVAVVSTRTLGTGAEVRLPFRADVEFRISSDGVGGVGYGADEGSIRIYHGVTFAEGDPERPINGTMFAVNAENSADTRLSREMLEFRQPIFDDLFAYPKLGAVESDVWHTLTWIVGAEHLACVLDGEVRFCGAGFPYMRADAWELEPRQIVLGSNGQRMCYFRKITVSQLKTPRKTNIKQGELTMQIKQNSNILQNLYPLTTGHLGENYWFNGAARFVMDRLGATELCVDPDNKRELYDLFAAITGDTFAQVYEFGKPTDALSSFRLLDDGDTAFFERVFEAVGYAVTFVPTEQLRSNREMYRQLLIAYIDKGVPVIAIDNGFRCIVGYEESGATLAYMYGDAPEPQSMTFDELLNSDDHFGWLFVGERARETSLAQIYRDAIINLPSVLTTKTQSYVCGAEAFRAWANDIDGGRFDGMKPEDFESWGMHQNFVCMLATNSGGCQSFLERAMALNPDFAFLEAVREQYRETSYMWMGMYDNLPPPDGAARDNLEALGGGFNVTLEALQNPEKRAKIAALLRKFADCMDEVVRLLTDGLKACREGENK